MLIATARIFHSSEVDGKLEDGFYWFIGNLETLLHKCANGPFETEGLAMKDFFQPPKEGTEIRWKRV